MSNRQAPWYDRPMQQPMFNRVAATLFGLIALFHLVRILYGWEATIAGRLVPMWISWTGLVIAAYLGYSAFQLRK